MTALLYGNLVSLDGIGGNNGRRISALSTFLKDAPDQPAGGSNPNDATRSVAFEVSALTDFNQWRILDATDSTNVSPVMFGEIVCLRIGRLRDGDPVADGGTYFLSCRDWDVLADGRKRIGVFPYDDLPQAWEKWLIVDPNNQSSNAHINFGDTFALKALSGSDDYLSRPTAGGVFTSRTLGDTEKWSMGFGAKALSYGISISLTAGGAGNNNQRLSALNTFVKDDLDQSNVFKDPNDFVRDVGLDRACLSTSNTWTILDRDGHVPTEELKYGDTICLNVAKLRGVDQQSSTTYYLSYLENRASADGKKIGLTSAVGDSERWKIIDPATPTSTERIRIGDTLALKAKSGNGDYLNRSTTCISTSSTPVDTAKWSAGAVPANALRYGNSISIGGIVGENNGANVGKRVAAVSTSFDFDDPRWGDEWKNWGAAGTVAFDASPLSDSNQWTVLLPAALDSPDFRSSNITDSSARVKFGDIVYLVSGKLRDGQRPSPSTYYLSQKGDGELLMVTRVEYKGTSFAPETWQLVDPQHSNSTAEIKFGDTVAFLSGDGNAYLSRPATGGVSTSISLGSTEKWVIGNSFLEVDEALPDPQLLQTASDNSAAPLTFGTDIARTLTLGMIDGFTSFLPVGGSLIGGVTGGLVGYLWQSSGTDLWDIIKSHVEALVNEKIDDNNLRGFVSQLKGVEDTFQKYRDATTPSVRPTYLADVLSKLDDCYQNGVSFLQDNPQITMPHLVALGTLHITALREQYVSGPELTADYNSGPQDRSALKNHIKIYSDLIKQNRAKALDWRRGQISKGSQFQRRDSSSGPYQVQALIDTYLQTTGFLSWTVDGSDAVGRSVGRFDDWFTTYVQNVVDIFGQQLDVFLIPTLLWRYMDPDCDEVPRKRSATTVNGPYGRLGPSEESDSHCYWDQNGKPFFYNPTYAPITKITISSDAVVNGLFVWYGDQPQSYGFRMTDSTMEVSSDMKIIAASGGAGWSVNQLSLLADKHQSGLFNLGLIGGGRDESGMKWKASPPANTDAFLLGFSGNASENLDTLYLHWQYSLWK